MIKLSEKQISYIQESICISIAVCFGIAVFLGFSLSHGYWIPMTTAIMFSAAAQGQGAIIKKTLDRVLGTVTGALFGFLYIDILMYGNYHWGYLLPLVWCIGFYIYFITSNYALLAVMITMFVPMLLAMMTIDPISISDTLFKRIACTIIGVSIALVAEYVIYRRASSAGLDMKSNIRLYFRTEGELIGLVSGFFLKTEENIEEFGEEYRRKAWDFVSSISSLENLYLSIKYEFDYKDEQERFYQYLFISLAKINRNTRKLMGIIGHDKYDGITADSNKLKNICILLADKYKNMIQYFDGRTDNCTEEIERILRTIKPQDRLTPTYLFVEVLLEYSKLADELSSAVYNRKFETNV